jgi:hypothetical protein
MDKNLTQQATLTFITTKEFPEGLRVEKLNNGRKNLTVIHNSPQLVSTSYNKHVFVYKFNVAMDTPDPQSFKAHYCHLIRQLTNLRDCTVLISQGNKNYLYHSLFKTEPIGQVDDFINRI